MIATMNANGVTPRPAEERSLPPQPGEALTRKQRLETLEDEIRRSDLGAWFDIGKRLAEIRENELWRDAGFKSWPRYCREKWEWSKKHCNRLVASVKYREALPAEKSRDLQWNSSNVSELTRLGDVNIAAAVAKKAIDRAKAEGRRLSGALVRECVNTHLQGEHPQPAAKSPEETGSPRINLRRIVSELVSEIEEKQAALSADQAAWERFTSDEPELLRRLVAVSRSLTVQLIRACQGHAAQEAPEVVSQQR